MIRTHICTCVLFVLMCGTNVAAITATLPGGLNTFPVNAPIVKYTQILSPDVPAYNPLTGRFTAPVNGIYLVSVTMMSGTVAGHTNLMKTGFSGAYAWLYTGDKYDMATQTVCVELTAAQQVWVQMANGATTLFGVYNTFTVVRVLG